MNGKKFDIIWNIIILVLIWGIGLYNVFVKNDQIMIIIMLLSTYLLFRKPKKKS
ncbi:hypothetical protein BN000_01051 [Neobacillus massiliamazoniensis]|uniref:Uncharacterized protein n=1 Tax=Neobacillus massiliamazoniensis TaxID=1499688 RepID=A0A0U1NSV5_9BACI|nr:hypothetical protein BN000_01051 [Neobacillus massiliamazoniensis]